jgi:hypothetical protein
MSCYDVKTKRFRSGIFEDVVDCTYVILCCGDFPKREEHVWKELDKLKPTKLVKLVYNKGFKTCPKRLVKQSTEYDLRDALMYVFEDSKNYKNILVLEDDFETDDRIFNHVKEVNSFLSNNCPQVYGLGNVCIINPLYILSRHQRLLYMGVSQAIIYNKEYRAKMLDSYKTSPNKMNAHVDAIWLRQDVSIYRYYIPLIYQKHPITENVYNWPGPVWLSKLSIKILGLDKDARKGYDKINMLNYTISILLLIGIFYLTSKLRKRIQKSKKK